MIKKKKSRNKDLMPKRGRNKPVKPVYVGLCSKCGVINGHSGQCPVIS